MDIPNLSLSFQIYEEAKFWGPAITGIWAIFRIINWVKKLKTEDLAHITKGINDFNNRLDNGLEKQTNAFVNSMNTNTNEARELRGDVKMLTSAILNQTAIKAAAVRKRKRK